MAVSAIFATRLLDNFEANRGFAQMAPFHMSDMDPEEDRSSIHDDLSDGDTSREDASSNVEWDVVDDLEEDDWEDVGSDVERVGELAFHEDDLVHLTYDIDWDNAPFDYDAMVDRPRHIGYEWEVESLPHLAVPWLLIVNARRRRPILHVAEQSRRVVQLARTAQTDFAERARSIGRTTQAAVNAAMTTQGILHRPVADALSNRLTRIRRTWPQICLSVGGGLMDGAGTLLRDGVMTLPPMATQHAIVRRYR